MLNPERCQLLLIDAQERLFPAMPEGVRDQARRNWESLLFLADALGVTRCMNVAILNIFF